MHQQHEAVRPGDSETYADSNKVLPPVRLTGRHYRVPNTAPVQRRGAAVRQRHRLQGQAVLQEFSGHASHDAVAVHGAEQLYNLYDFSKNTDEQLMNRQPIGSNEVPSFKCASDSFDEPSTNRPDSSLSPNCRQHISSPTTPPAAGPPSTSLAGAAAPVRSGLPGTISSPGVTKPHPDPGRAIN